VPSDASFTGQKNFATSGLTSRGEGSETNFSDSHRVAVSTLSDHHSHQKIAQKAPGFRGMLCFNQGE
jgi:hypothetical protein